MSATDAPHRALVAQHDPPTADTTAGLSAECELERRVGLRAARQVFGLRIEVRGGRVVLQGRARSYHFKQLAQEGVRELLPRGGLENAITVDGPAGRTNPAGP
jgi:hypothetical protein